ncbi:phosphate/phosphite/phosphonate ABC transporter substrate-binding protein [Photobacterium atrarenae]|uniref:Phosphate/phosphite/phosphonate ABC transporter substrate-binding protein n=1 Tax=Photobacterium atrarenae TaxID=865757 RepID=A0ABY5GCB1_9GAMM|nr:phosphate/phosphite/phosphonate ABC transporter substrate-binding protein [Photobacterium atrarenae]UTV26744.1 phosphate/phosphite/phosphonate ABC transporter substrate-binding protein [Photobacterium atrarenae]
MMSRQKNWLWLLKGPLLVMAMLSFSAAAERQVLVFGVVPQQSAAKLAAQWIPLLEVWGKMVGTEFRFATAPDIPTFEARLQAGEYDLAYMNPYHFTLFHQSPGYHALAHAKDKRITGILVARKGWQGGLVQLDGQTLAFPAPRAFAATVLTQSELDAAHIRFRPQYVGSHDSVYLSVAKGLFLAGGGVLRTFNSLPASLREQLQVIHKTARYTPHAVAYHPKVDPVMVSRLKQSIALLNQHPEAAVAFSQLKIKGWELAEDRDWDDVAALEIRR